MSATDNIERARQVFAALGDLSSRAVVFGATTPSLYGLPAHLDIRITDDVDLLFDLPQVRVAADLAARNIQPVRGATMARYRIAGHLADVVSTDGSVGANRWLADAFASSQRSPMLPDLRVVSPIAFVALKLEAFHDPGREHHGDLVMSKDIEDIVLVLRGVSTLIEELGTDASEMHRHVRTGLAELFAREDPEDWIAAHVERDPSTHATTRQLVAEIRAAIANR